MGIAGNEGTAVTDMRAMFCLAFNCAEPVAEVLAAQAHETLLTRGTVIWPLPGREETSLILSGNAQEVAYGRDGGLLILHVLGAGDIYGSLMSTGGEDTAQIEATENGRAAHFTTVTIVRAMETYSVVALAITRQLARRLEAMRRRMVEATLLSVTGRICSELLRRSAAVPDRTIRPMPIMSELAISVQSTRETVSRTVSQLEKRGIVRRVDGGLAIVAPHRLEEQVY
ncbi:MAG: Crp/Fnr family transcriptional regulator [Proteobacteria bacterium]|nr:Crp/Fnr family transcriptional regulator [Pseudomonadota bacterium]